ncbi:MAG TPA: molybdate ABC transporter substrate-binding protein [Gammaproteobacteria bacterium]|nr:molybdate ABC transporter substrate-binding protein [Gammaproteobacteria bacterium]
MKTGLRGALLALALTACALGAAAAELTVFAAASLTDVLPALADAYAKTHEDELRFSFAASSALARQIEAGAEADVFVSADEEWMNYAAERKLLLTDTRAVVAGNRLVLIGGAERAPVTVDAKLPLAELLGDGRLALGDPAHVPAGRYAQLALEKLGLWSSVKDRLAPAESVRVALMYVTRGETPLGIVYATDARGVQGVKVLGEFAADTHPPIHYPAAVLAQTAAPEAARAFVAWLSGPAARAVWGRYGFEPVTP